MAHFSEWLLVGYSSRPGHSIPIKFYANILFSFFSHFWIKSVCYLTARFKNSFLQQIEDVGRCIVHLVWELIQHWHWHRADRLSGYWIRLAMNICWGDHCIGEFRVNIFFNTDIWFCVWWTFPWKVSHFAASNILGC